jgi:hypothetical protein
MNSKCGVYSYTQEAASRVFKTARTQERPVDLIDSSTYTAACRLQLKGPIF